MKKVGLLQNSNRNFTEGLIDKFLSEEVEVCSFSDINLLNENLFDLVILYNFNNLPIKNNSNTRCINIHPSLLPAFEGENAIERAYKSGVKVTGITISDAITEEIIAQYPIYIRDLMHFDELTEEINKKICSTIPKIAKALLEDKIIDFCEATEAQNSCCGGQCGGCNHERN